MKWIFDVCTYIVMYLNEQHNDLILDFRLTLKVLIYFWMLHKIVDALYMKFSNSNFRNILIPKYTKKKVDKYKRNRVKHIPILS